MGRKEELAALNTPTDGKQFRFYLGDAPLVAYTEQVVDWEGFERATSGFIINTDAGLYTFEFPVWGGMTTLSAFQNMTMTDPDSNITTSNFITDYFQVFYEADKIYIVKINFIGCTFQYPGTGAVLETTTYSITNELKFPPDGWEADEYTLKRDMKSFGVFRKFVVGELKFVKDGRDNIINSYEQTGVNTDKTLTVTENTSFGSVRTRFAGKIDHSTLKQTEISADVAVIDGSFTDLVLSRANMDVNLFSTKTVDGLTIGDVDAEFITMPDININQVASWQGFDYDTTYGGTHYIFLNLISSEYDEARSVVAFGFNMFSDAVEEYVNASFNYKIKAVLDGNDAAARFTYNYYISKWVGGLETILYTGTINAVGDVYPIIVDIDLSEVFTINVGDSLSFRANITNTVGTGSVTYTDVSVKLNTLIENIARRDIYGILYHEAFERLIQIYTGYSGRFKSDFFGRTDLGYAADGVIGAIFAGRYIRDNWGLNNTMAVNLASLFNSLQAVYNLGMGVETIDGVEKVVIEPMEYFFSPQVVLNVSDRIAAETIEKSYYPELSFNRISIGFNSYEYKSLGGVYEFNTTSKFATPIKPVDKELNLVSPYRADMSGILELITEPATNKDMPSEENIFLIDTIRNGGSFIIRTTEGFVQSEDLSNRDTLFNVMLSPERNLIRWGSYIRGFAEKDKTKSLIWQTSNKNTKLKSTLKGGTEVSENSNVLISSLADPLWHCEILTFEVPSRETDIEVIQENKYGLIQCSDTEYGWIIDHKSHNENEKSKYILIRCNTDFVTPIGDPVYPSTLSIKKDVTGAVVDYTVFYVNIIGDNGIEYLNVPISSNGPINLSNVPYGTYTISENAELGYSLISITPSVIVIDKDNLHFIVEIINQLNAYPVIEDQEFTIYEHRPNGYSVGIAVATDPEGQPLLWSILAGNTGGAFTIDPNTGEITVADTNDLEFDTNPVFSLTVQVSDGTYTDTAIIRINLLEVFTECADSVVRFASQSNNLIGLLTVGAVIGTGVTIGNYVIEWRLGSTSGDIVLLSGIGPDPVIQAFHPLVSEPVVGGNLYAVIRYIVIDGVQYTPYPFSAYGEYSPDLLACLGFITVVTMSCNNESVGQYGHYISYINTTQPASNANRTLKYDLNNDGSTTQLAWQFEGQQIADRIKFIYCLADGTEVQTMEDWVVGADVPANNFIAITHLIRSLSMRRVIYLDAIAYTAGDYVKIEITASYLSGTPNTNWALSLKCFTSADEFNCDSGFTADMQTTDIDTLEVIWNAAQCRYEVHFHTLGIPTVAGKDLFQYYNYPQVWTGQGSNTNFFDGTVTFYLNKTTSGIGAGLLYQYACVNQQGASFCQKTGAVLNLSFGNVTDYNAYKTAYNNVLINPSWTDYSADPTNINHYKFFYLIMRTASLCGDAYTNHFFTLSHDAVWVFDDINYEIEITLVADVNEFVDVPCSTVYEVIDSYVNQVNNFVAQANFTNNTGVRYSTPVGIIKVNSTTVDQNSFKYYEMVQLSSYQLNGSGCNPPSPPWCIAGSSGLNDYTFHTAGMFFEITDPLDGVNNWRAYSIFDANGCLITNPALYTLIKEMEDGVIIFPI
jgi:hypothetical protein